MEEGGHRWQPALVETLPLSVFPPRSRAGGTACSALSSTAFELQQHSSLLDSGPDLLGCHCSSPKQHYQATWPKLSLSAWQIFF